MKILVLGDSTAVGTGSKDNMDSTAGRLGSKYLEASIENYAANGQKLDGLLRVIEEIDNQTPKPNFDLVLIQIGANDVIRLTSKVVIEKEIEQVLSKMSTMSSAIIFLHSGDIGESNLFPFFFKPLLSSRSMWMRELYLKKDKEFSSAHYVDLYSSSEVKTIDKNKRKYYAPDLLHLNGEGYGIWFAEIEKVIHMSI
jgi:lysophospholipase L1-like esterase